AYHAKANTPLFDSRLSHDRSAGVTAPPTLGVVHRAWSTCKSRPFPRRRIYQIERVFIAGHAHAAPRPRLAANRLPSPQLGRGGVICFLRRQPVERDGCPPSFRL